MNRYNPYYAVGYSKPADWGGVLKLAAVVGIGVAGFLLYRQYVVSQGTIRGIKRTLGGEG